MCDCCLQSTFFCCFTLEMIIERSFVSRPPSLKSLSKVQIQIFFLIWRFVGDQAPVVRRMVCATYWLRSIKTYYTLLWLVTLFSASSNSGQFAKAFCHFADTVLVSLPTNSVVLNAMTMLLMTRHKELRFSSQNSSLVKDWSGAGHLTAWTQDRLELRLSWDSTLTKRPLFFSEMLRHV